MVVGIGMVGVTIFVVGMAVVVPSGSFAEPTVGASLVAICTSSASVTRPDIQLGVGKRTRG
jgi:hypothetical protein